MLRTTAVALCLSTGCSFALVSGPPPNHQQLPAVECTTSRVGPVLDTVWTALQTLNLVLAASESDAEWDSNFNNDPPFGRSTAMVLYAGMAALGGAGMYYGYTKVSECKAAKTQLLIRSTGTGTMQPQPGVGTWPPQPQQPQQPPPQQPQQPPPPPPPPVPPAPMPPSANP